MLSSKSQRKGSPVNDVPDDNLPPWPEWNDNFLNRVQWNSRPLKPTGGSSQPSKVTSSTQLQESLYEDPAGLVLMPADMPVAAWMRPHQVYPDGRTFVLDPDSSPLDLLEHNKHLLDFKIMRMIIASVACLERESFYRPFPVEFQSAQFVYTEGWQWKPWYHVYSLTSAGRGASHKPKYNVYGKYIVRIFYLGKWRRVYVDDLLPVSAEGELLLPTSRPDNLWLPLLSKALLRVAALSWQPGTHNIDFTVIHCLTGWIHTSVVCKYCSEYQLWCICSKLMPNTSEVVRSPGGCISDLGFKCPQDDTVTDLEATESQVIVGFITDPFLDQSFLRRRATGVVTNQDRQVLFTNARYNKESPNPLWKKYRWEEWAINKGIISDIKRKPVRSVQILNPLRAKLPSSIQAESDSEQENDQEYWVDFDILIQLTKTLEVYYKPSYFKYNLRAWNLAEMLLPVVSLKDVVSPRGGKVLASEKLLKTKDKSIKNTTKSVKETKDSKRTMKSGKETKETTPISDWPVNLKKQSFFYLIIDSMYCKQLYICLSGFDPYKKPTYAHVVFGKFQWHRPTVAPIVFMMSTSGTKGYTLSLSPGRHVFRVWHQVPSHFCLQIFSNTTFSTGSKMYIQQALAYPDTASYQHYGDTISSSMEKLLSVSEGGEEHGKAYDQLMNSLMPPRLTSQLTWPHWHKVYIDVTQAFEECLIEMIVESAHSVSEMYQAIQAFQTLLLNPVFGEDILLDINSEYYHYLKERKKSIYEKEKDTFLVPVVQESEKGKQKDEKKDKSKSPKSEKSNKTKIGKGKQTAPAEPLRKRLHCKEPSLLINSPNNAIILLKKIMAKVPALRQLYPFAFEDDYRLVYQDYIGKLDAKEEWVVLVRCVFNTHSTKEVPCSLHIWAPLQKMLYRLIDNDTLLDVPLGFVEDNVAYLSRNMEGYTFCVYGLAESSSIDWRMRSIGVREGDMLHICSGPECHSLNTQPTEQYQQTLSGSYLPNKERLIARCFLDVYEDVTVLLKLQLSDPLVFCSFSICLLSEEGECIQNTTGIGHMIIPILKLKGNTVEKEDGIHNNKIKNVARYQIEVKVLNDTWPLSLEQIKAMLYYKEHMFSEQETEQIRSDVTSSTQLSMPQTETDSKYSLFEKVDKPTWTLTVVSDLKEEMPVKLCHDTYLNDQLKEIKAQWLDQDIDFDSCKELRQNVLTKLADEYLEDCSEENVFHLKATKTEQLTEMYGRRQSVLTMTASDTCSEAASRSRSETVSSSHTSSTHVSNKTAARSGSTDTNVTGSVRSTMVQQAGIHRALDNIRERNKKIMADKFEETMTMRSQVFETIVSERKVKAAPCLKKGTDDKYGKSSKVPKSKKSKN